MDMSGDPAPGCGALSLDDGDVYWERWAGPETAPELHFAHANGFNTTTYRTLLAPVSAHLNIVATDFRGHGRTTLPADPAALQTWWTYAHDLVRVLDAMGPRPRVLAGHSMGAVSSLLAASLRPDLASAVVLFEPVTMGLRRRAMIFMAKAMGRWEDLNPLVQATRRRRRDFVSKEAAITGYTGKGAFRTWPADMLKDYVEGGLKEDGKGGCTLACAPEWEAANYLLGPPPIAAAARRLKCPVIVLAGTNHSTVDPGVLNALRRVGPNVEVTVIDGATHFLPMEHRERAREAILRAAAFGHR